MNKIILIIGISMVITGCVSSKVNNLHSKTSELSTSIVKFAELSNRTADLNRTLNLKSQEEILASKIDQLDIPDSLNSKTAEETFNQSFRILNHSRVNLERMRARNQLLVAYFQKLPLILENKEVDFTGLIKNVDLLNQAIEKNISDEGMPNPRLKEAPSGVIASVLSNGFSGYQIHLYKESINNAYPAILSALVSQKNFFKETAILELDRNLNSEYYSNYTKLKDNYSKQYQSTQAIVKQSKKTVRSGYSEESIKALDELVNLPYKPISLNEFTNEQPQIQSNAYKQYCVPNEIQKKDEKRIQEKYVQLNNLFLIDMSNNKDTPKLVVFDIDKTFKSTGEQLTCELINIMGILYEGDYKNIELSTLGVKLNEYNNQLDYIMSKYIKKNEEK
ncbi:hypothetical protein [Acinetobacter calcoaceticus]|uniref:hypothetical protein n=1 Tax=Acinetobacter calcoaceticus TaxID=471 RepID=UPI00124C6ADC|nr:hypothetical protein [Acinetobacter calcoaceticus]